MKVKRKIKMEEQLSQNGVQTTIKKDANGDDAI